MNWDALIAAEDEERIRKERERRNNDNNVVNYIAALRQQAQGYRIVVSGAMPPGFSYPSVVVQPAMEQKEPTMQEQQEHTMRRVLDPTGYPYIIEWIDDYPVAIVNDTTFDLLLYNAKAVFNRDAGIIYYFGYMFMTWDTFNRRSKGAITGATTRLRHSCPPSPENASHCIHCGVKL